MKRQTYPRIPYAVSHMQYYIAKDALYALPPRVEPPEGAESVRREDLRMEARYALRRERDRPAFIGFYVASEDRDEDERRAVQARKVTAAWCKERGLPVFKVRRIT